jgi:hypothetical protein
MKNRSGKYGKTRETLPLVEDPAELWRGGGREKGGGERLDGHSKKTQETLYGYRAAFMEASQRQQIEGFKFRRQQAVGRYVVDFVNLEKKVVVELDGRQHALDPGDKIRDEWLRAEGYKVLRFWDNQVFSTPHPDPLPQGERGDNFCQYIKLKKE